MTELDSFKLLAVACRYDFTCHPIAREARILLTFDKGFGELANAYDLPAASGVVLFRVPASARRLTGTSTKSVMFPEEPNQCPSP